MNSVLVVEDEEAIRELVAFACEAGGFGVRKAGSVGEAEAMLEASAPDIVILDWMLPDCSGLEWLVRLRASPDHDKLPVILLTARGAEGDRVSGLEAGADDYVVKPFSPRELVARVRAVLRRQPQKEEGGREIVRCGVLSIDKPKFEVRAGGEPVKLGVIEFRMLLLMAEHPGRVYSRSQILQNIWPEDPDQIDERTVDVHILRLRRQLSGTAAASAVETVRGVGYRVSDAV